MGITEKRRSFKKQVLKIGRIKIEEVEAGRKKAWKLKKETKFSTSTGSDKYVAESTVHKDDKTNGRTKNYYLKNYNFKKSEET